LYRFFVEDDLAVSSLTPTHIQASSPQPSYAQNPNFVTSHMLGQTYATDNSNFGPIYHPHHNHHAYGNPYEKYKVTATPAYGSHYQGFYGHHQIRQVDYIPR